MLPVRWGYADRYDDCNRSVCCQYSDCRLYVCCMYAEKAEGYVEEKAPQTCNRETLIRASLWVAAEYMITRPLRS